MGALRPVIEDARREGAYQCARCGYALSEVPLQDDLSIVCPECGYEMVFRVKVQLMPRDPDFDRAARTRLQRLERLMLPISLLILAGMIGCAIVVYAITH